MWTRTQNPRVRAWSQEAAAAQWPVGEKKTIGLLLLPTHTVANKDPTSIFTTNKPYWLCWQSPHSIKPSESFQRPPTNPSSRQRQSRVHSNRHSMRPTASSSQWTEDRELFTRRKTSLCLARSGFQPFWHSSSRMAWSLPNLHSYFYSYNLVFHFTARIWMSNLLTIHFYISHSEKQSVRFFLCSYLPIPVTPSSHCILLILDSCSSKLFLKASNTTHFINSTRILLQFWTILTNTKPAAETCQWQINSTTCSLTLSIHSEQLVTFLPVGNFLHIQRLSCVLFYPLFSVLSKQFSQALPVFCKPLSKWNYFSGVFSYCLHFFGKWYSK